MLSPEDAWLAIERQLASAPSPAVVDRARDDAVGLVLADDLLATVDMPPADVSAMDGYVLAEPGPAGTSLPVIGTVAAGRPVAFELAAGQAAKIMTGAVVPARGDRVVPVEETRSEAADQVTIQREPPIGAHIRRLGEVVRRGAPLLASGTFLTPGAISLLASHGHGSIRVYRQPEVAVLSTGDEVVSPDIEPAPGQLRDSNTSFLMAGGRTLGLRFRSLGIAPDRVDKLRALIAQGLEGDVLLLCGGVSMGDYDFVEGVLNELGCALLFDRVAIQPGKPLVVATRRDASGKVRWIFGLPGNPASVMVTFWLFVRPLLRRRMGLPGSFWRGAVDGELTVPLPANKGRDRFLAAEADHNAGRVMVTPYFPQGSHDVQAYARGTALVRIAPHAPAAPAGSPCQILPLLGLAG